jgi:Sulfotransferase family
MRLHRRHIFLLQILVFVSGILHWMSNPYWKTPDSTFSRTVAQIPESSQSHEKEDVASIPALPKPRPPSRDHSLIYVHVGKTGGITLDKVLQSNCMWYYGKSAREKCLQKLNHQNSSSSKLSELTRATLHFGPRRDYTVWIQNATLFLMTLRNPIARALSAYNFDHPDNQDPSRYSEKGLPEDARRFYVECFPTIQHMTKSLEVGKYSKTTKDKSCRSIAVQTLAGNGTNAAAPHLRMNYNYYHGLSTALYPDRPLLAIRTEFLWHDLQRLDSLLGGDGVFEASGLTYTHGSPAFRVKKGLSATEKLLFCCYLIPELQLYQDLIERSINLLVVEKKEVLNLLYLDCGRSEMTGGLSWRHWAASACSMMK